MNYYFTSEDFYQNRENLTFAVILEPLISSSSNKRTEIVSPEN